eukprot:2148265-Prymnesium_polylepis.1
MYVCNFGNATAHSEMAARTVTLRHGDDALLINVEKIAHGVKQGLVDVGGGGLGEGEALPY